MKKKFVALTLLAIASGMMIASCDNSWSTTSEEPPATSTTEEEVVPTRVKINQPGTVLVGEVLKISEICTFDPAGATGFSATSSDTAIATVTDNETIEIVGPGVCAITLKANGGSVLGKINITAMTATGKALQEWSDGVTNNFCLDAVWTEFTAASWDDVTEENPAVVSGVEGLGLLVTEKYVIDGTYGPYNAISLEKADGSTYGFTLLNEAGNEVDYVGLGFKKAVSTAASVEIGDQVSASYLNLYFVLEGVLNVTDFTEVVQDGESTFVTTDPTVSIDLMGNLFGMSTSDYTGKGAVVTFDAENQVLDATVLFDTSKPSKHATAVSMQVTAGNISVPLLEEAVVSAEPPAPIDVTGLANHFGQFTTNYIVDWEIGIFSSKGVLAPSGFEQYCKIGRTVYADNILLYGYAGVLEGGKVDTSTTSISGYYVDETGVYQLVIDEETLVIEKAEDPISTKVISITDIIPGASAVTLDLLQTAELSVEHHESYGLDLYSYNPTFDNMGLFAGLEDILPFSYGFAKDPDNAKYCQATIYDYSAYGEIDVMAVERVALGAAGSGLQGTYSEIYGANKVPEIALGTSVASLFKNLLPSVEEPAE